MLTLSLYINNVFDQTFEIGLAILIPSQVDSSQHHFLEAMIDDALDIVIDVFCGSAGGSSSDHRDDTVGTEVVAPVVDLDQAAGVEGVVGRLVAEQVAVVAFGVALPFVEMLFHDVENGGFAFVVDDIVGDAGLDEFLFTMVDHAACDDQQGFGVFPSDLMDGLSAFLVAGVGDRAGVHHEDVGLATLNNLIATCFETRGQGVGFIEVHTASKGFEGDGFHFNYFTPQRY